MSNIIEIEPVPIYSKFTGLYEDFDLIMNITYDAMEMGKLHEFCEIQWTDNRWNKKMLGM